MAGTSPSELRTSPTVLSQPPSAFFSLTPQLQQAITTTLGWKSLRSVQEASIPSLLAGHDALILAPTAGGKTESALLPLLDNLLRLGHRGQPSLCYICPLKALINNLLPRLQALTRLAGRDAFAWHGEVSQNERSRFLQEPKDLLLTTPESLQVILSRSHLDVGSLFEGLQAIIIDEVHALAGTPRGDQTLALLHQLDRLTKKKTQRVGLSATVGNPHDLLDWLTGDRGRPHSLVDPNQLEKARSQRLLEVHPCSQDLNEQAKLISLLTTRVPKSLLFTDSRRQAELLRRHLDELGQVKATAHHSSLSQEIREATEATFVSRSCGKRPQVIVCTSTLELGLDVGDIDKVFQLGAPYTVSAFLQRFGRAGRRQGQIPHMVFVTDNDDSFLRALALISLAIQSQVEPVQTTSRALTVLVQQILLLTLKAGALSTDKLWTMLERPPCFSGITFSERNDILDYLLKEDWLSLADSRILLGSRSEKTFGGSNYLEWLSVFSSTASATVKTLQNQTIGTLDASVASRLASERASFILAGKSWLALRWDSQNQILTAQPSIGGEVMRWSGSLGQQSFAVSRAMRTILTDHRPLPFLGPKAQAKLQLLRQEASYLDPESPLIWCTGRPPHEKCTIELWAGNAVHLTLAHALAGWLGCPATSDKIGLCLNSSFSQLYEILVQAQKMEPGDFLSRGLTAFTSANPTSLPHSVKFLNFLPPTLQQEVLWQQHYDLANASTIALELRHYQKRKNTPINNPLPSKQKKQLTT